MERATKRAFLTRSGMIRLCGTLWSEEFPVGDLASRIAFYEGLARRASGRFAAFHLPTIEALHVVKRRLEAMGRSDGRQ